MEPDIELIEPDPYNEDEWMWRPFHEVEEWAYDQGYDSGIQPLWNHFGQEEFAELGREYLLEGPECAEMWVEEQVEETVDKTTDEYLETYVDGQMRLYAGYDVAENGDTLEEGSYIKWKNLRMMWEAGFCDKLRGNDRYDLIK